MCRREPGLWRPHARLSCCPADNGPDGGRIRSGPIPSDPNASGGKKPVDKPAVITNQAIDLAIHPVGVHGRHQGGVHVRSATMERLVMAHEALQLVTIHLGGSGIGRRQGIRKHGWCGWRFARKVLQGRTRQSSTECRVRKQPTGTLPEDHARTGEKSPSCDTSPDGPLRFSIEPWKGPHGGSMASPRDPADEPRASPGIQPNNPMRGRLRESLPHRWGSDSGRITESARP